MPAALKAYSAATSIRLFYESDLITDRMSAAVHGSFPPPAALRMLLVGTGLVVTSFDAGTVTILPAPERPGPVDLQPAKARARAFTPYLAQLQAGVRAALCHTPATRTDASELRIQLWIAPSGSIARAELLTSTGSEARDRSYLEALRTLVVAGPPVALPQPITLMILPRSSPDAAECLAAEARSSDRALSHD